MIPLSRRWFSSYRAIIFNSGSLVGTTAVTSGLGFLYWWLAARLFAPSEVGIGAAAISAMTLIGTISTLGLGTMLTGELARNRANAAALTNAAMLAAGAVSMVIGVGFAVLAPFLSKELSILASSPTAILMFALGASFTAIALVLDPALIGLLRADVQFMRNTLFSVIKLGALAAIPIWFGMRSGLDIYLSWLIGNAVTLVLLALYGLHKAERRSNVHPDWRLLHGLGRKSLEHHVLNLAILGPSMLLPIVVTTVLSAEANAYFYTAWMLGALVGVGPTSLTSVLYAVGSGDTQRLTQQVRFTLGLGFAIAIVANLVLWLVGDLLLGMFGQQYVAHALWPLRILGLSVVPLIMREHFVAIRRIENRAMQASAPIAIAGVARIAGALIGTWYGGLVGLTVALLIVECLIALTMLPLVYRTAAGTAAPAAPQPAQVP